MAQKVMLDPLTRIEGHLAVSLTVENGYVQNAQCSGEMFRGFETILQGRSPLDAQQIIQRICGVCPISHGIASVLAQEDAYKLEVPQNGRLIRNILLASNYIQSHLVHFYHLSSLDFIDVGAVTNYTGKDPLLTDIKAWVRSEASSQKLFPAAPFLPKYSGDYIEDKEVNIGVLRNYFIALEMRSLAHQIIALFAGKMPHVASLVPGGITEKVDSKKIAACYSKLSRLKKFVQSSYREDVLAIAESFPQYFYSGKGYGDYLSFGAFRDDGPQSTPLLAEGVLIGDKLQRVDTSQIEESVAYSRYSSDSNRHITRPQPDKQNAYSWIKAPRYNNKPLEVGPLARMMVAYEKDTSTKNLMNSFLTTIGRSKEDLNSCMGRHLARYFELEIVIDKCAQWIATLQPDEPTAHPFTLPTTAAGQGLMEAPRGALGHWIEIKEEKISRYECIVPTTWNCSPKDDKAVAGPMEHALQGTYVQDKNNPLEAARIIRSFDPCLACAVH